MTKKYILAGDIGGTKTRIGLFSKGKTKPKTILSETYSSRDASGIEGILESFFKKHPANVERVCLGMAGPVFNGRCKVTNLPWDIDERKLQARYKWPSVKIINDLAATAMMVPLLTARDYYVLNKARRVKNGNIVVVAPGTGLGAAMLVYANGEYYPVSSEGGHVTFAPGNRLELDFQTYLKKKYDYASYEHVVSGQGLVNIFSYLKDVRKYRVPSWLLQEIKLKGIAIAVTEGAINRNNLLCVKTLKIFLSSLGSFTGNLALTGLATGGVYLGGGILPDILTALKGPTFMGSFVSRGRFQALLRKMPVRVILNKKAALLGAAEYASRI